MCATIFPPNWMLASYVCTNFRWQTFALISIYSAGNISVFYLFIPIREISSWLKIILRIVHHFLLPWNNTMILFFTLVIYNGHGLPLLSIYNNSSSGRPVGRLLNVLPSWKWSWSLSVDTWLRDRKHLF